MEMMKNNKRALISTNPNPDQQAYGKDGVSFLISFKSKKFKPNDVIAPVVNKYCRVIVQDYPIEVGDEGFRHEVVMLNDDCLVEAIPVEYLKEDLYWELIGELIPPPESKSKETSAQKELPPNYTFSPLHHGLVLKSSSIHGNGVFATIGLDKDFVIGPSHINLYCTEMIHGQGDYIEQYHPGGLIRTSLGGWVNHSEDDNIMLIDKGCFAVFATTRRIEEGEELLINYHKALCGGEIDYCG
jgi:hypothetical protein